MLYGDIIIKYVHKILKNVPDGSGKHLLTTASGIAVSTLM